MELKVEQVKEDIITLRGAWGKRNEKFKEWFEFLVLSDKLKTEGMESYSTNEPQTFYNMAHYLLTMGEVRHAVSVESETAGELEKQAMVERSCQYMWRKIDEDRLRGGYPPFLAELGFDVLVLGWYSMVLAFNKETGMLQPQLWSPSQVYPRFEDGKMVACVHEYPLSVASAVRKSKEKGWNFTTMQTSGDVKLDDYFILDENGVLQNMILIDDKDVTGQVSREELRLLVSPVAGFPERGTIGLAGYESTALLGRSIFEVNAQVTNAFNRWKTYILQILRDTAQPVTEEFSSSPQATPEQLRERGALFHYSPGEGGLQRVAPPPIPLEVQVMFIDLRREIQKGGFNDAVYGMVEGQPGYALSALASSSANQILYPYMEAKHFIVSDCDNFWLSQLKTTNKTFQVKGKLIEELKPADIPEDVNVRVESDIATQKDWLERATIAGMLRGDLDETTILTEILKVRDAEGVKKRKKLDKVLNHPLSQQAELIAAWYSHADYLQARGDSRQASIFRRLAQALEGQIGAPQPGQARAEEAAEVEAARQAGAPQRRQRVLSQVQPPEAKGFTPQQLRQMVGRGKVRPTGGK